MATDNTYDILNKRHYTRLFPLILLSACSQAEKPATAPSADSLPSFVGCWDSEDGLSREGWTADPSGWLVGYSANRNAEGQVTFFEHMRIERGAEVERLVISGMEGAPVAFTRRPTNNPNLYRFENADHDFPQVITYELSPGRLDAWISALDGSNRIDFKKAACSN